MPFEVRYDRHRGETLIFSNANGEYSSLSKALTVATRTGATGKLIFAGRGSYVFDDLVEVTSSNFVIEVPRGITLRPSSNGMFKFTGDNISILGGGRIEAPTFYGNTSILEFNGCENVRIEGLYMIVDTNTGSGATPMDMIYADSCVNVRTQDVTMIPGAGVRMIYYKGCTEYVIRDSTFKEKTTGSISQCWRVWDIEDSYEGRLDGNVVKNLGNDTFVLDECVICHETAAGTQEAREVQQNNTFQSIGARNILKFRGRKTFKVHECTFLNMVGTVTTADYENGVSQARYDSAIVFHNINESISATVNGEFCAHAQVHDCMFDAVAQIAGTGCDVYIKSLGKASFRGNHHGHMGGRHGYVLDADHCQSIKIIDNYFDGGYPGDTTHIEPVKVLNRVAEDVAGETIGSYAGTPLHEHIEGIRISDNTGEGWKITTAFPTGFDTLVMPVGARGGLSMGIGGWHTFLAATTISFTPINAATATIADSGSGFGNISANDWIMVVGADNEENNGLRIVLVAVAGSLTVGNPSADYNSDPVVNSGAGWEIVTEAAGATVGVYVYPRSGNGGVTTFNTNQLFRQLP